MGVELIINVRPYETRVAVLENNQLAELYIERRNEKQILGNIYRGKVVRVLPGMQAAFVDIGYNRTGFLFVSDMCTWPQAWQDVDSTFITGIEEDGEVEYELKDTERFPGPGRNYNIQDLLKEGQEILVQVSKEPLGSKGPRLTCHISLPGRYLVMMPTMNHVGISKKIDDPHERERLRAIVETCRKDNVGYIVRTVSEGVEEDKIKREMDFLHTLWRNILKKMEKASGPRLLYSELSVSLRAVRDLFTMDVDRLVIDSEEEFKNIVEFIENFDRRLNCCILLYGDEEPIFDSYGIEMEINKALEKKVWLKSGGYIVIEPTEAFTIIDVNTGSYVGKKNLEDTILKTNLEAAKEIAYQIRLRNLSGIIIIDFIDMNDPLNREKLIESFKEYLKKDRAKTTVFPVSPLGLVEMTRKRTRSNLYSVLSESCPYCHGSGFIRSKATICYDILREIERQGVATKSDNPIYCILHPDVESYLKEEEHEALLRLEKQLNRQVIFVSKPDLHVEDFEVTY